ncbi:ANTAR domain protein [Streptomonospora litoralis]|uniref:ANTAR domain protein n=2 Tax=Streptomonospora litoralis TaxID=2498135 RepID=A0A4P6Q0C7_9ACTN|nr:ANTAR domain protein [Streptomonospora litoralis]
MTDLALTRKFVEVTHRLSEPGDLTTRLNDAVALAADAVPGCDYAGVTVIRRGRELRTPAYSDASTLLADGAQYELDEGPCVDTARSHSPWLQIDDIGRDGRWPSFAEKAEALGVRSVLSCQLSSPRGTLGALNLYSESPGAFGPYEREVALLFTAQAGMLLAAGRMEESLRAAIDAREHIGIAMGILMERHKVSATQAFEMLSKVSQDTNTKVRDLASHVIETGEEPAER